MQQRLACLIIAIFVFGVYQPGLVVAGEARNIDQIIRDLSDAMNKKDKAKYEELDDELFFAITGLQRRTQNVEALTQDNDAIRNLVCKYYSITDSLMTPNIRLLVKHMSRLMAWGWQQDETNQESASTILVCPLDQPNAMKLYSEADTWVHTFVSLTCVAAQEKISEYENLRGRFPGDQLFATLENIVRIEATERGLSQCIPRNSARQIDPSVEFRLLLQKAHDDDAAAQFAVAQQYESGIGGKKDLRSAYFWYVKASKNAHTRWTDKSAQRVWKKLSSADRVVVEIMLEHNAIMDGKL